MGLTPKHERIDMIAEIARLYHEENYNLAKIARQFHISTSTVSRLLKEAHDLKIVQIIIRYPFLTDLGLSEQLKQQYRLKAAFVFPDIRETDGGIIQKVGQLAARVLEDALEDGCRLGISLGQAVSETARAFRVTKDIHCPVLRLHGANQNELAEGTDLAQKFSLQLGNEYRVIPSPWIMTSVEACESILQEPTVRDLIREAESVDVSLVGIGAMDPSVSTIYRNKLISASELQALREAGAVGEICGKYYDEQGRVLDAAFNRRSVSIDIGTLRKVTTVIAVAAGGPKAQAIAGALRGKLINVLVTDTAAAKRLVRDEV